YQNLNQKSEEIKEQIQQFEKDKEFIQMLNYIYEFDNIHIENFDKFIQKYKKYFWMNAYLLKINDYIKQYQKIEPNQFVSFIENPSLTLVDKSELQSVDQFYLNREIHRYKRANVPYKAGDVWRHPKSELILNQGDDLHVNLSGFNISSGADLNHSLFAKWSFNQETYLYKEQDSSLYLDIFPKLNKVKFQFFGFKRRDEIVDYYFKAKLFEKDKNQNILNDYVLYLEKTTKPYSNFEFIEMNFLNTNNIKNFSEFMNQEHQENDFNWSQKFLVVYEKIKVYWAKNKRNKITFWEELNNNQNDLQKQKLTKKIDIINTEKPLEICFKISIPVNNKIKTLGIRYQNLENWNWLDRFDKANLLQFVEDKEPERIFTNSDDDYIYGIYKVNNQ
ncbi:hypothetical protein, partial [Mycoplasma nasistruthionis]